MEIGKHYISKLVLLFYCFHRSGWQTKPTDQCSPLCNGPWTKRFQIAATQIPIKYPQACILDPPNLNYLRSGSLQAQSARSGLKKVIEKNLKHKLNFKACCVSGHPIVNSTRTKPKKPWGRDLPVFENYSLIRQSSPSWCWQVGDV